MYGQAIKNEFVKRKKDLIILTVMITIIMYFLMGNNSMIKFAISDLSQTSGNMILDKCFSFSYNKIILLFFVCATLVGILFKNKAQEFNNILNNKEAKRELFFNKIITIVLPIFIGIFINSILKIILYYGFKKVFYIQYGIEVGVIMTFITYVTLLTLLFSMIMFLFNVMINDPWIAAIIPGFIFEGFILTFSINLFFISEKLNYIKDIVSPLENFAVNIMELLYLNIRLESQNKDVQINLFIILIILIILMSGIIYMLLSKLTKKKIQKPYISSFIRHVFYLSISFVIGFYSVSLIGYVLLLNNPKVEYEEGLFIINIIAFITVIILYIILNLIYKFTCKKYIDNDDKEVVESKSDNKEKEISEYISDIEETSNISTVEENNIKVGLDDKDTQNIKNFLLMETKERNDIDEKEIVNDDENYRIIDDYENKIIETLGEDIRKTVQNDLEEKGDILNKQLNEVIEETKYEITTENIEKEDKEELIEKADTNINEVNIEKNGIVESIIEETEIVHVENISPDNETLDDGTVNDEKENIETSEEEIKEVTQKKLEKKHEAENEKLNNEVPNESIFINKIIEDIKGETTTENIGKELIEKADTNINEVNIEENSIVESIIEEIAREESSIEDKLLIVESINSLEE